MTKRTTSAEDDAVIVQLYVVDKWPIRRIASAVGISYGTVHDRLKEAGVTFRRNNWPPQYRKVEKSEL
jgi:DNA-directed RNA polymerase specialized sigma24 family protein